MERFERLWCDRRRKQRRTGRRASAREPLDRGNEKGQRLAGARLGLGKDVVAAQRERYRQLLHLGRSFVLEDLRAVVSDTPTQKLFAVCARAQTSFIARIDVADRPNDANLVVVR